MEELDLVLCLKCLLSNKVFHVCFSFFYGNSSVFCNDVLGVPVESVIMMIFAPDSIHPYFFALSSNFFLNRLMGFYSPSNSSGSLRISLLKSLISVIDL